MTLARRPAAAVLIVVMLAAVAYAVARSRRDFWDFEVYRTAGTRVLQAEPLYRPEDGHYQYKYWPAFAVAMIPFAVIGDEAAKVLWYALSVGLIALFLRQSISNLPDRQATVRFLTWWTLACTAKFLVKELVNGQTNALLGVLVMLALGAVRRRRPVSAAVFIGLAAFVKPYALLFIPWLLVTAGLGSALVSAVVIAGGLVLPALRYGWQGNLTLLADWYHTVAETTPANLLFPENISFLTMWAKWIGEGPTASALAVATTVAALGAAAVVWWKRRGVSQPEYLEVSVLLLLVPLISPQGWDYVLLLATPAIVCLLDRFGRVGVGSRAATVAGLVLTSLTIYDLVGRSLYLALMAGSVVSVGALLLAGGLVGLRLRALA